MKYTKNGVLPLSLLSFTLCRVLFRYLLCFVRPIICISNLVSALLIMYLYGRHAANKRRCIQTTIFYDSKRCSIAFDCDILAVVNLREN